MTLRIVRYDSAILLRVVARIAFGRRLTFFVAFKAAIHRGEIISGGHCFEGYVSMAVAANDLGGQVAIVREGDIWRGNGQGLCKG